MSAKKIQVDQFLINELQPEIDALNLSLVIMEENGYASKAITDSRKKLNKLIPIADFLKEYAYGTEEVEDSIIDEIMTVAGMSDLSSTTGGPIIQATRDSLEINKGRSTYSSLRVYQDDVLQLSRVIPTSATTSTFQIFSTNNSDRITATVITSGVEQTTYEGISHVTIPKVDVDHTDFIGFEVKTYRGDETLWEETVTFQVLYPDCSERSYWAGSTTEAFRMTSTDLTEMTTITTDPNSGTNPGGTELTYAWVTTNFNSTTQSHFFRVTTTQTVSCAVGDRHTLIMFPNNLKVTDIREVVLDINTGDVIPSSVVPMTEGVHYDSFTFNSTTKIYNCIYLRDLTSLVFPARTFQFTISKA